VRPRPEVIRFAAPLRDVRLAGRAEPLDPEREIRERERASFERGLLEGPKARDVEFEKQRGEMLELHHKVIASLQHAVPQVINECEQSLVRLALEVAQRLVGELPISAGMVESSVREALHEVEENSGVIVTLNPDDLELVRRANSPLLGEQAGGERVQFDSSPEISRGGCVIKTRFGMVDARRETKITALKEALAA
jgi:flagellar assembly protein FliH